MPKFETPGTQIGVDTDGPDGDFIITLGKKKIQLGLLDARLLSEQIGYAVEFVNLYARGPR